MSHIPNYASTPPSREKTLERMSNVVRIGHDTLIKEHEKLLSAFKQVVQFGYEKPVGEIPYQYLDTNQKKFYDSFTPILSATYVIDLITNKIKSDLFRVENMIVTEVDALQGNSQMPPMNTEEKSESKSIVEKVFGSKKRREVNDTDPYQIYVPNVSKNLLAIKKLELFMEYQAYGVRKAPKKRLNWMMRYKAFHYSRFQFAIAPPIIRLHRQYIDMKLTEEQKYAVLIASSTDRELFKSRNDMNLSNSQN